MLVHVFVFACEIVHWNKKLSKAGPKQVLCFGQQIFYSFFYLTMLLFLHFSMFFLLHPYFPVALPVVDDVFKNSHGSNTDIAGVVMYEGPVDQDTDSPLGLREVAVIDAGMRIIFLHIFKKLAQHHWNELLSAEENVGLIMATSMEVDQLSKTLLSTGASSLWIHYSSTCHNFNFLKGVHHQVLNDLYFRDAVKTDVLLRKYARKRDDMDNSLVPKKIGTEIDFRSGQSPPVKHIFNYAMGGERPPININKMDQLD